MWVCAVGLQAYAFQRVRGEHMCAWVVLGRVKSLRERALVGRSSQMFVLICDTSDGGQRTMP